MTTPEPTALRLAPLTLLVLLAAPEWKEVKSSDGITVEARPVAGSSFAELRATTTVALPVDALCAGAFGTPHADPKEPSLKSRRVISETENERVTYDQISAPIVSDRDYAVRTRREPGAPGHCRVTIDAANEVAPPVRPGLVRIEKLHCVWDFDEQPDGGSRLSYVIWTDPNTSLPAFLVEPSRQKLAIVWTKLILERAAEVVAKSSAAAPSPKARGSSAPAAE